MNQLIRVPALLIFFMLSGASRAQEPISGPPLSAEEYRVIAAAIDTFRREKIALHPVVADRTSTFDCGSTCNGMTMDGCNGLRQKKETPAERLTIVRHDLPKLQPETVSRFESENQHCSEIAKRIPVNTEYLLFNSEQVTKLPTGWEHPDLFYFSRVAFNARHTQALIHISFVSGTNAKDTAGKYFLFTRRRGKWVPRGSSKSWELVSH